MVRILFRDAAHFGNIGKRNTIMKKLIGMLMAVALATVFLSATSAADDTKPGQGKGPRVVPGENVQMTCPHCKDDYVVKTTKPPKGTESEKVIVGTHLCQMCSTKLTVEGTGKSQREVKEHTCKNCAEKK
jgi:hypothetical protein